MFIAMCLVALIAWTAFNSVVRAWQVEPFDPYPYIFLNLILSMLAALQAPIILMSQNSTGVARSSCRRPGLRGQPEGRDRNH